MLEIEINGECLELPDDIAIPVKLTNPLFTETGSHTLSFDIPLGDKNKRLLGHPQRITSIANLTRENARIKFDKKVILSGRIFTIQVVNGNVAKCFFVTDEADFITRCKEVKLRDIDFGNNRELGSNTGDIVDAMNSICQLNYGDLHSGLPVIFNFPTVYSGEHYGSSNDKNTDWMGFVNAYDSATASYKYNEVELFPAKTNQNAISAYLYYAYVIERILAHFELTDVGGAMRDSEIIKLLLWNNYDLARKEKKYYVRSQMTTGNYSLTDNGVYKIPLNNDYTAPNEDNDDCWTQVDMAYVVAYRGTHRFKHRLEIVNDGSDDLWIRVGWLNYAILTYLPACVTEYTIPVGESLIIDQEYPFYFSTSDIGLEISLAVQGFNPAIVPYTIKDNAWGSISNDGFCNLNQYQGTVVLKNLVPDKTVNDFLKATQQLLGLAMYVNSLAGTCRIDFVKTIVECQTINDITSKASSREDIEIKQNGVVFKPKYGSDNLNSKNFLSVEEYTQLSAVNSYQDLPVIMHANDVCYVRNLNQWWVAKLNDSTQILQWTKMTDEAIDMTTGDTEAEFKKIEPEASPMLMARSATMVTPAIKVQATSPAFDTGTTEFDIKLMIYHLRQEDLYGLKYPFASSMNYNFNGDEVGALSLSQQAGSGIIDRHYGQYFSMLAGNKKPYTTDVAFSFNDLTQINLFEKFKHGRNIGRIAQISTTLRKDRIDICEVEFWPE